MTTVLKSGQTILFVGASIVDFGRRDYVPPLGEGFVRFFAGLLAIREPEKRIKVINKGIGGNRIRDLQARWYDDVVRHKPDHLVIQVGMNDILSLFTGNFPWDPGAVNAELYEELYDQLLTETKKALPRCLITLIDPFLMSTETDPNSHEARLLSAVADYSAAVKRLSKKHKTRLVEVHRMFQNILKYPHRRPAEFCPEPIHPGPIGHIAMAQAVYDVLSK